MLMPDRICMPGVSGVKPFGMDDFFLFFLFEVWVADEVSVSTAAETGRTRTEHYRCQAWLEVLHDICRPFGGLCGNE